MSTQTTIMSNNSKTPNTKPKKIDFVTPDSKFSEVTKASIEISPKNKVNLFLLCMFMLGIGVIGGYFVFLTLHGGRCSTLMDAKEQTFSKSHQQTQDRYLKSVEQYQKCLVELNEANHASVTNDNDKKNGVSLQKHQDLMDRHQATVNQLMTVQSEHSDNLVQQQKLSLNLERCEERTRKLQSEKRKCQASKELMKQLVTECKEKGTTSGSPDPDL